MSIQNKQEAQFIDRTAIRRLFESPITRQTLRKWEKCGIFNPTQYRIGGKVFFKLDDVLLEIEKSKIKHN